MRKTIGAAALAVLLLLAGCSGSVDTPGSEPRETTTVSPTVNGTTSPATSTASPNTRTINQSRVIEFHELNDQQQSAFREALQGDATFVPNSSFIDESEGYDVENITSFQTHDYVRHDGELYQIRLRQGELYASYAIRASAGSPDDDDTVVAFDSLPEEIQDEVQTAITDGEYYAPMGKWQSLPEPLGDTDYVRYENQTYEMEYVVGDAWAEVLTVEKSE